MNFKSSGLQQHLTRQIMSGGRMTKQFGDMNLDTFLSVLSGVSQTNTIPLKRNRLEIDSNEPEPNKKKSAQIVDSYRSNYESERRSYTDPSRGRDPCKSAAGHQYNSRSDYSRPSPYGSKYDSNKAPARNINVKDEYRPTNKPNAAVKDQYEKKMPAGPSQDRPYNTSGQHKQEDQGNMHTPPMGKQHIEPSYNIQAALKQHESTTPNFEDSEGRIIYPSQTNSGFQDQSKYERVPYSNQGQSRGSTQANDTAPSQSQHQGQTDSSPTSNSNSNSNSNTNPMPKSSSNEIPKPSSKLEIASGPAPNQPHLEVNHESGLMESINPLQNRDTIGSSDILKIEHTVRNLQIFIKKLIDEAPDLAQFQRFIQSDFTSEEDLVALKRNNNVKLAAHLKTLYDEGKLGLFDEIISFNPDKQFSTQINLESEFPDADLKEGNYQVTKLYEAYLDNEDISQYNENNLPPLPKINDPTTLARVFMHKSVINDKVYLNDWEMVTSHNERLEFLGDSVLNNVMTLIIYKRFEHLSEGDLSKIRTELISNVTLAKWAVKYGLDKQLKRNVNDNIIRNGKMKIFADVFEAYVGGLTLEHGSNFTVIKKWLQILAEPTLQRFGREVDSVAPLNKSAKAELYALIGSASISPSYDTISVGNGITKPFIVRCMMNLEELGRGVAPNVKEAGLRAAMHALNDRAKIDKYSRLRGDTPRNQTLQKPLSLLRTAEHLDAITNDTSTENQTTTESAEYLQIKYPQNMDPYSNASYNRPPIAAVPQNTSPELEQRYSYLPPNRQPPTQYPEHAPPCGYNDPYQTYTHPPRPTAPHPQTYQPAYSSYQGHPPALSYSDPPNHYPSQIQNQHVPPHMYPPHMYPPPPHPHHDQPPYMPAQATQPVPYHYESAINGATGSVFPLYGNPMDEIDNSAKNGLYALLGRIKKVPIYKIDSVPEGFKVELRVGPTLCAISVDRNKKIGSTKAAMAILANPAALRELGIHH